MKILHVIDRLNIGGAERVFLDSIKLLTDRGVHTGAMIFNAGFPWDGEIDKRVTITVLNRTNKYSISKLKQANSTCSAYDIVHVHMRHCYAYIRAAQLLFRGKYKIIFHDHYGNIEIDTSVPVRLKYVFKPEYYIGVSQTLVKWATDKLLLRPEHIFYLSNTIIPNTTVNYQYKPATKKCLLISNIRQTKNIEFAIELSKKLGFELTIYGNSGDEEYFSRINCLVGDDKKIQIVRSEQDIFKLANKFDFAIHCAKSETGPLVMLEYLAYGIPFIAYKTGEVAAVLANELPECFVSSFEQDEWQDKIAALNSIDRSDKLKSLFKKHFSAEKYIDECLKIYQKVLC